MAFRLQIPEHRELLGGDLLAQSLAQLGASTAFGIHGGHLDSFLIGAVDAGIQLIDVRHETVAVQAAEGWAKVKGNDRPGVCFVTANSGFCNALPGLSTAFADRSPVFCITSSPPLRDAETNTLQGLHDQVIIARTVTKFAHRVTIVGEIPRIVSLAWRATTAGAPGPVLVDFPIDILFTPVQNEDIAWGSVTSPAVHRPGSNPAAIDDVINIWQQAKRPVILVSTGAASAAKEVVALAEETNTPIFHSFKYSTKIPTSHPLWGGPANTLALLRNQSEQQPDFVLILGARTGFITGGRSGAIVPREADAKVVQVDLDGSEIGRSRRIDVGIVGDVALVAVELTAAMAKSHSFKAPDMWVQTAVKLKESRINSAENEEESVIIKENGRLHPYHGVKTLLQSLPHGSILCIDGGEAGQWALQNVSHARADLSMNVNGYLGFLGNGFGYALGAAVAEPEKLVVNWHGDGSAGFHIGELDTYAKFGLKILTVVVNNSVWGMSEAGQELIYGEKTPQRPCVAMNPAVRYEVVAQGFGCESVVVDPQELGDNSGEQTLRVLREAVEKLTQSQRPALLNLKVSNVPYQSTTKAMVGQSDDPNIIVVPYYDNLPRPYYKASKTSANGNAGADGQPLAQEKSLAESHGTIH